MFIEQLSDNEMLYIVEMATSLHYPIEYKYAKIWNFRWRNKES